MRFPMTSSSIMSSPAFIGSLDSSSFYNDYHLPNNPSVLLPSPMNSRQCVSLRMAPPSRQKGAYAASPNKKSAFNSSNKKGKRMNSSNNNRPPPPKSKSKSNNREKRTKNSNKNRKSKQTKQSSSQPEKKKIQTISIHECKTMGEAIQNAHSNTLLTDYLTISEKFTWLPTDDNLQPHLRSQAIHHEKRRRWGSQLLEGLGQSALALWEVDGVFDDGARHGGVVGIVGEDYGGSGIGYHHGDDVHDDADEIDVDSVMEKERKMYLFGTGEDKGATASHHNNIWTDERFVRAVLSVALPFVSGEGDAAVDRPDKEGVWIASALKGLHVLSGCISPRAPSLSSSSSSSSPSPPSEVEAWINLHRGISMLIQSADELLADGNTLMKDAVETRWAIRGLVTRLQIANRVDNIIVEGGYDDATTAIDTLEFTTPHLNARTSNLPFDILHHCLPWQMMSQTTSTMDSRENTKYGNYFGYPTRPLLPNLLHSIPFNFDILTTRTGNSVIERRGTAWLAEDGIGALAYSGKLMSPVIVPDNVRGLMREVERYCVDQKIREGHFKETQFVHAPTTENEKGLVECIWEDYSTSSSNNLPYEELGRFLSAEDMGEEHLDFFDCSLCNHYPDGDSACKFHTDPEHGSHWHRTTAVVSCGTSRKFAFRPIPDISTWSEWDTTCQKAKQSSKDDAACAPAVLQLFPGDVVFMTGECNDVFHHAVYASPFDGSGSSRVSLVFKRALDRGGGRKGHSLKGEGRRARRRSLDY